MSFGNAAVLACVPVAFGLALLAVRRLRAQQRDPATRYIAKRWADHRGLGDSPPVLRDAARGVLLVAGVSLAVVALARPQWGEVEQQSFDPAREVLLALDLSRSMTADDVAPTRLDRAKLLVETLLDALQGERVGLVVFAGTSFLQSPLSADYEVMRDLLEGLDPDYLPQGGTRYDLMLRAALDAYSQEADADRFLVVLSDGEAHNDAWRARLPSLRKKGIRVIALGVGTPAGSILSDGSGAVLKDERGAAVLSRLEADTLRALAEETDGIYRDAAGWVDIAALVDQTVAQGRRGAFVEERQVLRQERFQWLLGPALLLLVLSAWLELPVAPSARSLRRAKEKRQPRPVFFETPGTGATLVWLSALLLGVGAARSADATPGASPQPAAVPENPLVVTIRDLIARPSIGAGDYAGLAEQTLEVAQQPEALAPEVRNGVIDDALAAVSTGESLDADAADWAELRRRLEALPRETPPPESSEQGESSENESADDGDSSDSQQGGEGSESESDEASGEADSESEESESASDSESGQSGDPSDAQSADASDAAAASGSDSPEAQAGSPDELPQLEDDSESGFGELDSEPATPPGEAPEPPTPTRMVGGGNATPDISEHPELADALGKLQNVRDRDSPSVLFERMNAGQQPNQPGGKNW